MTEPENHTENVRTDTCSCVREVLSVHYYSIRVQQNNRYIVSESWQWLNNFSLHGTKTNIGGEQAGHFKGACVKCDGVWSVNSHEVWKRLAYWINTLENKKKSVCVYRGMLHTHFFFTVCLMLIRFSHFIMVAKLIMKAKLNFIYASYDIAMLIFFCLWKYSRLDRLEPEPS